MTVLAFLTDPEVVRRIPVHLGWPTAAPPTSKARSSEPQLGFELPPVEGREVEAEEGGRSAGEDGSRIRPPP